MSENVYFKMIVSAVPLTASIISLAIIGQTWISNVFRNPDATVKGFSAAAVSIAAIEIMSFACLAVLFYL